MHRCVRRERAILHPTGATKGLMATTQAFKGNKVKSEPSQQSLGDLPSTEQVTTWMHAVCGHPVKSTWIKTIKAGNVMGSTLLVKTSVKKDYPEMNETSKRHMNQTMKNVRSTKTSLFEEANTVMLKEQITSCAHQGLQRERDIF